MDRETSLEDAISVGMGDLRVAQPPSRLAAMGIGSCVAVMVRDRKNGTGGMAHIMLPSMPQRLREGTNRCKYADYAIVRMVELILEAGGGRDYLEAKLVGGGHMFESSETVVPLDIGSRNVEAVRKTLADLRIPIVGEDTGGNYGRSVEMRLEDGSVQARSLRRGIRRL
jgi:chemotaxis protein CheD